MSSTKQIGNIIDTVYSSNTYTKGEERKIYSKIEVFMERISKSLKTHSIDAEVFLGGSSAKGTLMKGKFDSDIFVRFDYKKYRDFSSELSDILEKIVQEAFDGKAKRVHGSRDYFMCEISQKGKVCPKVVFEIIPVLKINSPDQALNVTDVSPLHVLWVNKLKKESVYPEKDIVVTKIFMRSIGVYGAESYIRGFSGHDVDILLSYYGSFEELLKSSLSWKKGEVIDIENHYRSESIALTRLNASKHGPLILIDPVQKERNAAASLSLEKFNLFKEKSKEFLANPSTKFFLIKKFSLSNLRRKSIKGCRKIIFHSEALEGKQDVIGSKLLKVYFYILKKLKMSGFEIVDSGWHWDKEKDAYFWFFVSEDSIRFIAENPYIIHQGPPLHREHDAISFRSKHSNVYEEKGRLFTRVKREYLSLKELSRDIVEDDYVQAKVASISLL